VLGEEQRAEHAGQGAQRDRREREPRRAGQAQRAGNIVRRIREFVKRSEPRRRPTPAARVVEDSIGFAEIEAAKRGITIRTHLPPNMPPLDVDPILIEKLSESLLDKSPIHLPYLSSHPKHKALVPLVGLETGSVAAGKRIMPSKAVPFPIDEWPSVVIRGLEILNRHNWFPAMTLIVGSPDETDDDVRATIDLIYEVERRGLFAFFIPSIFTPLHDTRMEKKKGVTETRLLSPLQWQLMMK
jgi:hypothetical protein